MPSVRLGMTLTSTAKILSPGLNCTFHLSQQPLPGETGHESIGMHLLTLADDHASHVIAQTLWKGLELHSTVP